MEEMNNDVTEVAEVAVQEADEAYKSGSVQYIDSREVAQIIGKPHNDLMKSIRRYEKHLEELNNQENTQGTFSLTDFFVESSYRDTSGKTNKSYLVTKKGCEFIAHKLTGIKGTKFTATYINRFHEMEDTLEKNELTSLEKLVRQQAEVIGNMQELVQDIVQKQNSVEQEDTVNNQINPYRTDITAELEGRKKELYRLTSKVADIYGLTQTKALHNLYLAMEESLNVPLDAYRLVYISETGNVDASTAEVIAANDRLYQAAIRINMIVIERNQIYE
jgi:Rha family phage regulatory protein